MTDLVFVVSQSNRNSLAALCGALDTQKEIAYKFNLKFIDEKDILEEASPSQKQIVCFSFSTPDVFRIQKLIPKIKKKSKNVILIAGGPHSSGTYQHTLKMGFDFVFIGEGEEVFLDFLKKYLSAKKNYQKIQSIEATPVDIKKFLPVSQNFKPFTPIEISRGCPHGCRFCQTTYLFGKTRHRTINQIVNSAKILVDHGWTEIRFVSPNILSYGSEDGLKSNLSKLEEMLNAVRNVHGVEKIYAGSFPSEVRPENATKAALSLLRKYSDNNNIIIGFQSGSDRMLKKMHRGHTVKDALEAIGKALEIGFKVNVDFIFGLPKETKEDEEETIKMMKKLTTWPGVRIHGHTFLPLPGTPWQNENPGKISKKLQETLKELKGSGKVYGDWEKQEKLAEKITHLTL